MTGLSPDQLNIARRRSVREWADIYLELLENQLREMEVRNPAIHAQVFSNYTTSIRPAIRRVVGAFEGAGLDLGEEMEFEGPMVIPATQVGEQPQVIWPNTTEPKITFFWPDRSSLEFKGDDAVRSIGFFVFWQSFQQVATGNIPQGGESRILVPGDPGYNDYMLAKAKDQNEGREL